MAKHLLNFTGVPLLGAMNPEVSDSVRQGINGIRVDSEIVHLTVTNLLRALLHEGRPDAIIKIQKADFGRWIGAVQKET